MIAKCVALLAIVAQINGYVCNSNYGGSIVGTGAGAIGYGTAVAGSVGAATTRNIVAKGKYPVALANTGPVPDPRVPVTTSHVQAPVQEKPTVRLAANIPAPRTVAHSCTCYKTILRPRVHNQFISVPSIQRYIETTHTPVVENIHYEAIPVNSPDVAVSGPGVSTGAAVVPSVAAVQVAPVSSVGSYSSGCVGSAVQIAPIASVGSYNSGCVGSVVQSGCY